MKKKILTLTLVGAMALGGTAVAYASTANKAVDAASNPAAKTVSEEQSNDEQELTAENTKTAITEDQAKQTALASIENGAVKEIELEDEDGVIVYGVEIQSGNDTYDVKIDANTGAIIKSEQDNEDNDQGENEKESN